MELVCVKWLFKNHQNALKYSESIKVDIKVKGGMACGNQNDCGVWTLNPEDPGDEVEVTGKGLPRIAERDW